MNKELEIFLAQINGLVEEKYEDEVRSEVSKAYFFADEIAILRKTVCQLYELMKQLHPEIINSPLFEEYNNKIEQIKQEKKNELGIE
jgi:hypothetical protein